MNDVTPVPTPKERGGCLTAFLVVMIFFNAVVGITYLVSLATGGGVVAHVPKWALLVLIAGVAVNIAAALAVWQWKRWGIWAFVAVALIAAAVNISLGLPIYAVAFGLLGPVILLALVKPLWGQFS